MEFFAIGLTEVVVGFCVRILLTGIIHTLLSKIIPKPGFMLPSIAGPACLLWYTLSPAGILTFSTVFGLMLLENLKFLTQMVNLLLGKKGKVSV